MDSLRALVPALAYAACWHLCYWLAHFAGLALVPWYRTVNAGNLAYYAKKLRLQPKSGPKGELKGAAPVPLTPAQTMEATAYFRNYTITTLLSAMHVRLKRPTQKAEAPLSLQVFDVLFIYLMHN
jgi:hypothetical protein